MSFTIFNFHIAREFSYIRDFQVPILVLITDDLSAFQNDEILSLCQTKLILICNEDLVNKVLPKDNPSTFAKRLNVTGKIQCSMLLVIINYRRFKCFHWTLLNGITLGQTITDKQQPMIGMTV